MHHWRRVEVYWATRHPGILSSQEELCYDCNDIDGGFLFFLFFFIISLPCFGMVWIPSRYVATCGAGPWEDTTCLSLLRMYITRDHMHNRSIS